MTNLIKRALTGAIYVALIVCSLLFGGVWAFPLLCCLLAAGAITEFCKLGSPEGSSPLTLFLDILLSVGIFVTPLAFYASGLSAILLLAALCLIFVARCVVSVSTSRPDPFGSLVSSLASIFYIVMPLALAVVMVTMNAPCTVLALFIMLWLNDTGAYLIGSSFGRHKMSPRISPKKSWEGFFGGLFFSAAGAVAMAPWILDSGWKPSAMITAAVIGIVIGVVGTWGDLVESMIKRSKGVKDAGNILPGHGGILDRIDSFLLASPVMFTIWLLTWLC